MAENNNSSMFTYKAVSPTGERQTGKMAGTSQAAVTATLVREGWTPLEVKEHQTTLLNFDIAAAITGGGVKLNWRQRSDFARRLHQLLRAGISLPRSLASLAEDAPPAIATMYESMAERITSGGDLADAMREHPRAFDDVTVAYIDAGESSGTLNETVERLSQMLAERASLQSKIKGVTAYPKLIGGAIGLLVMGIIMFLVPKFQEIYESFDSQLPAPTQALVWVSEHTLPVSFPKITIFGFDAVYPRPEPFNFGSILIYLAIGAFFLRRKVKSDPAWGQKANQIMYRLPVFGNLIKLQTLQRWSITLAGGLQSGVPITKAIELAAASSGSQWHKNIAPALAERVQTGRSISSEMTNHPDLYPPSIRTMVSTGEDTGELPEMLDSVAESLTSDIDAEIAGLAAKVEVALLVVLGVVVGGLLIILYLPILGLASAVQGGA